MIDRETLRDVIRGALIGVIMAPLMYFIIVGLLLIGG
jgi:hypothetical protein